MTNLSKSIIYEYTAGLNYSLALQSRLYVANHVERTRTNNHFFQIQFPIGTVYR